MGIDAGFDLVPRLSKSIEDKNRWRSFIDCVKRKYEDDDGVEVKANYIEFNAGEHPILPFDGHKFLRFSSKISGKTGNQAEEYIRGVTHIATSILGSRVERWSEMYDQYGFYGWKEVYESQRSYDQDETNIPSTAQSALSSEGASEDLITPCYAIRSIQDKGKGLIARVNIVSGTRILIEKPLFSASSPVGSLDDVVLAKVKALSNEQQREYLSLHNSHPGKNPFTGIFRTNALPCGPGSPIGAVYPIICFINHTCIPNSHNNWNSETELETIHAVRDIKAGEEITISYAEGEPARQRLDKLKNAFGFDCKCELCSRPAAELQESDARRVEIEQLDQAIGDPNRAMSAPSRVIADCQKMLKLIQQEYGGSLPPLVARLYYDVF
ncbi:hypothetical protein BDV95DRAFT_457425, partial [Massariosphaeria phaeospora]